MLSIILSSNLEFTVTFYTYNKDIKKTFVSGFFIHWKIPFFISILVWQQQMIRKYLPSKRQCVDFTHITKIGKNRCYLRKVNNVVVVPYGIYAILKAVKINFLSSSIKHFYWFYQPTKTEHNLHICLLLSLENKNSLYNASGSSMCKYEWWKVIMSLKPQHIAKLDDKH